MKKFFICPKKKKEKEGEKEGERKEPATVAGEGLGENERMKRSRECSKPGNRGGWNRRTGQE